jgi:hypothetical protein
LRGQSRQIALFYESRTESGNGYSWLDSPPPHPPNRALPDDLEPGITVIAQGRKRVELGRNSYIYGESNFLLTSIDLPIVSRVVDASERRPCLALSMKLEMNMVRELLAREEIHISEPVSDSPAMVTGTVTVEFLGARCNIKSNFACKRRAA